MLLSFRDSVKNSKWLKYAIIGVISVPFVLFGIGSYFNGGGDIFAAKVNDAEVSLQAYEQVYNQQRNRLRQAFGGKLPDAFSGDFLRQQALETAITQEVLLQTSNANGFHISDPDLADEISSITPFQVDGKFDKSRYEQQLQSMGMTARQFEAQMRQDVAVDQLRRGVSATAFLLPSESDRLDGLRSQQRETASLAFQIEPLMQAETASDEELAKYFSDNAARYQHPEKARVDYIELNAKALESSIIVTDDDLQSLYDGRQSSYVVPEERSASHILIAVEVDASDADAALASEKAKDVHAQIGAGADFSAMAREHSDDPGSADVGGDLGSFPRGTMVPEFEDALFAMSVGDISEPIRTEFGFHVIRLDVITPQRGKALEEVRDALTADFRKQEAESLFFDRSEALANAAYENSGSLAPAAEVTGLEIQTSDWIHVGAIEGIAGFEPVRRAAFSNEVLSENLNSEVLEIAPNHVIVLRLKEHEPARPKILDEVREEVAQAVRREKATATLEAEVAAALEVIRNGGAAESLAESEAVTYTPSRWIDRRGEGESPALVQKLFTLNKPAADAPVVAETGLNNGDKAVLIFSAVRTGPTEASPVDRMTQEANRRGTVEYGVLTDSLKQRADIVRNTRLLEELEDRR